jgi:hypothetical protein
VSPRQGADPDLSLIELVIVDGNNLLHAVRGSGDQGATAWLLPRLAEGLPEGVHALVVLDGHPTPGLSDRRPAAPGVTVRHAGSVSADDVIVGLLEGRPYAERARSLVVSDDRGLRDRARHAGAPSRPVDWLVRRMGGGPGRGGPPGRAGPGAVPGTGRPIGIGQGKPPPGPRGRDPRTDAPGGAREGWRPGRSATRKRGPAHRAPRRRPPG